MTRHFRHGLAAALLLAGCGDCTSTSGAMGELGNGGFVHECIGSSDPVCETKLFRDQLVSRGLAVGARFGLAFDDDHGNDLQVAPASPAAIASDATGLVLLRSGPSAVLAWDGSNVVHDLLHV